MFSIMIVEDDEVIASSLEEETDKIEKEQIYQKTFKELRFNWESLQKSIEQRDRELYMFTIW